MADQNLMATIVNHVAVLIAAPVEAVWQTILEEYVEARKFREIGYAIVPLDDPAAVLGGYRMRLEEHGAAVDERICQITEYDEGARRLSLFADYLSMPGGMLVYASYHAQETAGGARYAIDCHARISIEAPAGDTRADIAATISAMQAQFNAALSGYLESVKVKLEATD